MNVEYVKDYGPLSSVRYLKEGYAVGSTGFAPGGVEWLTAYSSHYAGWGCIFPTAEDAEVRAEWLRARVCNPEEIVVRRVDRNYRVIT